MTERRERADSSVVLHLEGTALYYAKHVFEADEAVISLTAMPVAAKRFYLRKEAVTVVDRLNEMFGAGEWNVATLADALRRHG